MDMLDGLVLGFSFHRMFPISGRSTTFLGTQKLSRRLDLALLTVLFLASSVIVVRFLDL